MSERLSDKWRKIIDDCPPERRKQWDAVFAAVKTCADELDGRDKEICRQLEAVADHVREHRTVSAQRILQDILKKLGGQR